MDAFVEWPSGFQSAHPASIKNSVLQEYFYEASKYRDFLKLHQLSSHVRNPHEIGRVQ